ncbi:DUF177 domain-containing protein [bacterium]|nr:DUF177 domain-containing protein [candidate division CSSED10-310 bacterium]
MDEELGTLDYKKIFLNEIPVDGLVVNVRMTAEELDMEFDGCTLSGEIEFKGLLQRFSDRYLLSGQLIGQWLYQCDRCLTPFLYPVKCDVLMHYVELRSTGYDAAAVIDPEIEEPEELVTDHINLHQALVEQMILQIPMKALCSENCKGLCPQCGENLNIRQCDCHQTDIDPRLIKLKNLLEK